MFWTTPTIAFLVVAALRGAPAGVSLGDLGFYEQLRRMWMPVATRSITMADVPLADPPPVIPVITADAAAPLTSAAAAAAAPAPQKDDTEAQWRERITSARAALARDEVLVDALQGRVNGLISDSINRDDPAQRAEIMRQRDRTQAELDRLRTQVDADKETIAAIEEDARKKGIPPGWIRGELCLLP